MHTIGVDLASQQDYTAVSVVRTKLPQPDPSSRPKRLSDTKRIHFCGYLERWRAKYTETVEKVAALANTEPFRKAVLACDQTGVGRPAVDMLREALPGRRVIGITITAGSVPTKGEHADDIRVPKKLLVSTLQVLLAERRVHISNELALLPALQNELQVFRVKITPALNETFEAWRERDHDDLVLSVGLASWIAENIPGPLTDEQVRNLVLNEPAPRFDGKQAVAGEVARSRMEELADDLPELFRE